MSDLTKKLILVLVTVILSLGGVEIILRVVGYGTISPEMNFGANTRMSLDKGTFLSDKDLFWKLPPMALDKSMRVVQPDVPIRSSKNQRKVLVLGDSCSRISIKLPPFPSLLEDSLQRQQVEVWNASVPGYTAWQGRAWLNKQLLSLQPDVAIIYYGWNDHWRSTGITDRNYAARQNPSSLRLAMLFKKMPNPAPLRLSKEDYEAVLSDMIQQLQEAGSQVILVTGPSRFSPGARGHLLKTGYLLPGDNALVLHREYLSVVKKVALSTGADVVDAAAVFDALAGVDILSESPGLIMRDGIHLTDAGHQMLASLLAKGVQIRLLDDAKEKAMIGTAELLSHAKTVLPGIIGAGSP